MAKQMINFNLKQGEVVRKYKGFIEDENTPLYKRAVWDMLTILNHEGLLPNGYYGRVKNGHIKYETVIRMVNKLAPQSKYRIGSYQLSDNKYLLALIEKNVA